MRNEKNAPDMETLCDLFGIERATQLCLTFGGARQYVPVKMPSAFVTFFVAGELERLADWYGGETVMIPKSRAVCVNYLYFVKGLPIAEIARQAGVHVDTVHKNIRAGVHPLVEPHVRGRKG